MFPQELPAHYEARLVPSHPRRLAAGQQHCGERLRKRAHARINEVAALLRNVHLHVMSFAPPIRILHLYISAGHNFFGHHEQPPGEHPMVEVPKIHCLAGRGIEGDRFFDFRLNYKGQITFFANEVYEDLCAKFQNSMTPPSVFRRNVITAGVDLNELIDREFELQGVRFRGVAECSPCHWMDAAFGPGAETALHGHGGLRAKILSSGMLRADARET